MLLQISSDQHLNYSRFDRLNFKLIQQQMEEEKKNHNKHVQWDEEKLKETEKFRGTFQKIDQPKTPYHDHSGSDEESMEPELKTEEELELEESLSRAKQNRAANCHKKINIEELNAKLKSELEQYRGNNEDENGMQDEDEEQRKKKKEQFKKLRAQHYNQFKLIQKMKQDNWEDDE